jgi:succinyl-diaminopimelate desuccinylase
MNKTDRIYSFIENSTREMIELQRSLCSFPALAPDSGGTGEAAKADFLLGWLKEKGFTEIEVLEAPDHRVPDGKRPNIIVNIPGKDESRTLWMMTHLDVVPPGEAGLWNTDPWTLTEKDGRLFGRGVEDNQQSLAGSIFAALALKDNNLTPAVNVKLLFVADEEVGSDYGIKYLLKAHPGIFRKNDLFLIPDGGRPDSSMVEIAEKGILWLRFTVKGRQCHASMPQLGINAFTAGSDLVLRLSRLGEIFCDVNEIFDPPVSTFCPTKKEANVPNINTIPGEDVFCLDSRVLPSTPLAVVLAKIEEISAAVEKEYGVKISYEIKQKVESKPTDAACLIVKAVMKAVKEVYPESDPVPTGVGGGTVAAYLRNAGYPAVVWATVENTAHMPNEYCIIENMVNDAKVMAGLMLQLED